MRYPNTGLYYFGKSLGDALIKNNHSQFDLDFFLYSRTTDCFDNAPVHRTYLKQYNKFFFINTNNVELFHFTDQLTRLNPSGIRGKKKILTIHDINQVHENISADKIKRYLKKLGGRIDACERVVTISNFVAKDVLTYFPHIADKLSVIYNGADKLEVKSRHIPGYIPQEPFLFTIGIVSEKKNFHVLPALLENNSLELVIAGITTPYQNKVMELAKKHNCENRVKIIGPVSNDDKAWYYKNCEAFVFPSIAEGFGLPVIEAMHFGKPVFVSNLTSLPEVAGNVAYYFNSFDAHDMQSVFNDGMLHYKNENTATAIIAHAHQFNWDNTAKQYLKLYKECL
ncbi:glycosyltransferase family 4 protein [Mucilaginibacter litoreus]|uniref:Glycosyltransferase family 4 protein n=2 Tax=Mucilaginibacter litoreus TaxID=1048221 RepID=A0ABW3AXH6_9SPHI